MSTSTWGEPEPSTDEIYPPALLKHFLNQMMVQFGADGACMALFDENINQMKIQAHMRLRSLPPPSDPPKQTTPSQTNHMTLKSGIHPRQGRRTTINLLQDPQQARSNQAHSSEEIEDVISQED